MALTQINSACLFPWADLFIFSPHKEPNICRKNSTSPSRILPTNDLGRKKNLLHLLYSYHSFFFPPLIGINSDLAGICSTTSLHRFRPLGKEIMKLIKFHTSFITPCCLPFANLSESSVSLPQAEECMLVHVNPKSELWLPRNRKDDHPLPHLPLLVHHHLVHEGNRAASCKEKH